MFLSFSHSSFSITTKCCSVAFVCAAGNSGQWRKRWVLREHLVLHEAHPVGRLGGTRSSHFPQRAHWQQGSDVTWSTLQIILVQTSYCWANFAWSCCLQPWSLDWLKVSIHPLKGNGLIFSYLSSRPTGFWSWRIKWSWPSSKTLLLSIWLWPKASGRPCPRCRSHTTTLPTDGSSRHTAHTTSQRARWEANIKPCYS